MRLNESTTKLSILLPFRNAENTFSETLDSIQDQTFPEFNLIAVDDHSNDRSSEILNSYDDPRFRLFNNPGEGLVDALNFGIENAQSTWIVRMDGDDIMHPQRMEKLMQASLEFPDMDLISSQVEMFSEAPMLSGYTEYMRWQNSVLTPEQIRQQIYVESPFAHPSVMFRKSTIEQLGGYRRGDFPEDYELWLRMHADGCAMVKLPEVLLRWRDSPNRLSRTHPAYSRQAFDRVRAEYMAQDSQLNQDRKIVYWGAGRKTRKRCQLLIEKGFTPRAWIDIDPKKIGNKLNGIEVFAPDWLKHQVKKPFVLIYVTNHGAREEIEQILIEFGYNAEMDYLAVG